MDTPPGKVIRSLRQALHMTQAEFGQAAGWSASTISSWERGSKQPSRLAFKTILAFAEERGVRYQPKPGAAMGPATAGSGNELPVLRLGSRVPAPPLVVRDAGREESLGSRRWTDVAADVASAGRQAFETHTATVGERPEWQVDARLQVRIGRSSERGLRVTYAAATLGALVLGLGAGTMLQRGRARPASVARFDAAADQVAAPSEVAGTDGSTAPEQIDELALAAVVAPGAGRAPYAEGGAVPPAEAPVAMREPMPAAAARLESIVALDGVRRASFRVGDRSIALVEGDTIGASAVARIANDEVTLVGGGGASRRVRLGFDTPLE